MIRYSGEHAIVVGGGVAGLLAARVLADHFDYVTVLERDRLIEGEFRSGTPQARHPHLLLARSRTITENLFPGIGAELSQLGAISFDFGQRARLYFSGGPAPATATAINIQSISRPALEDAIRARVRALPEVEYRTGVVVTGLVTDPSGREVIGVATREQGARSSAQITEIHGDLVVEASGRNSHLPDWLEAQGLPRPAMIAVDAQLAYATRIYDIPAGVDFDWDLLVEFTEAPAISRGCFALRVEGQRLICTLQGAAGDHPPNDEHGFLDFADTLRSEVPDLLGKLSPASPIYRYGATANRRYEYHRLRGWPTGLIAIGDAVCSFNPVYGQGITVAACEAELLDHILAHRGRTAPHRALRSFQSRQMDIIKWPWIWSTAGDRAWLTNGRRFSTNGIIQTLLNTYTSSVPTDPDQYVGFLKLAHMLAGPASLLRTHTATVIGASMIRKWKGMPVCDEPTIRPPRTPAQAAGAPVPH
ncbi:FAD-dependent oxidoreductase [Mycolicibacterium sp. XJ870]